MTFRVTETIHHGEYRNTRTAPFTGLDSFRDFLRGSPYPINPDAVTYDHLPTGTTRLDRVAENGYHALSIGRTFEHDWATYTVDRD